MPETERTVFVYGTLKPGGDYWPRYCAGKVDEPVAAKVYGRLYDLQLGYPGLVLGGECWVYGYLLAFKTDMAFKAVDRLEGYDPARSYSKNEYNRSKTNCYDLTGEQLGSFWVYEISPVVLKQCDALQIENGNWPIK